MPVRITGAWPVCRVIVNSGQLTDTYDISFPVGGGHIQGADRDPALVCIPSIEDGAALQQISRQRSGAAFAFDRHVQGFVAGVDRGGAVDGHAR